MRKEERSYKMFLDDIQTSMSRIAEYIAGYDFEHFKRDYKTVDAVVRILRLSVKLQKVG